MADRLDVVRQAAHDADQSQARLRKAVADARSHGDSWQQLGDVLGISRQAAQQRFKDVK
jgi:biotin operon repressor